jgi:hypothetical protein
VNFFKKKEKNKFEKKALKNIFETIKLARKANPKYYLDLNLPEYNDGESLYFSSTEKKLGNRLPLKTLKCEKVYKDYCYWKASYEEYKTVIGIDFYKFIDNDLQRMYLTLKIRENRIKYSHLLIKFETTFFILNNTIKECFNENGIITKEVRNSILTLLSEFEEEFELRREYLKGFNEIGYKIVNQSLVERLSTEIEFVRKYIKKPK